MVEEFYQEGKREEMANEITDYDLNEELEKKTRQKRREEKRRRRMPQHGWGLGKIYRDAIIKRIGLLDDNKEDGEKQR